MDTMLQTSEPRTMTQYDKIGASWDQSNLQFYKLLECKLLEKALRPEIHGRRGLRLLEFAAGTGFYTARTFAWAGDDDNDGGGGGGGGGSDGSDGSDGDGPAEPRTTITALDISQAMTDVHAAAHADKVAAGRLRLLTADGAEARSYAPDGASPGYFDGAVGGWFLNYARTRAELGAMLANVALNLRPGAFFVGTLPHPTEDLAARAERMRAPPMDRLFPRIEYLGPLEDGSGWWNRVRPAEGLSLLATHQRRSVVEEAARAAGFGPVEWTLADLPRDDFFPPGTVAENAMTADEYAAFCDAGIFSVIKMYKK